MKTEYQSIEIQIEMLVDGELPEGQRAAVLGSLDAEPGGWRRCALAYAETQMLGESLAPGGGAEVEVAPPAARVWRMGAIAAAIVAAFFAGRVTPSASASGERVAERPSASTVPAAPRLRSPFFRNAAAPGVAPAYVTNTELPEFVLQALIAAGHRVSRTQHTVRLDSPDGSEIELPLTETLITDMRPLAL